MTASPQAPVTLPAARRLAAAKRLAKEAYALARERGSVAVPARLQRAAGHTTAMARVAIVGERKRGKSTLVNALIGQSNLLPRDVDVATNTYIEVVSPLRLGLSPEPRARVHLQSGAVVESDLADLGRWASEQSNPQNARRVAYVQVLLSHPLLDAGLVLLDTPGLGGLLGAHGTMTLNALDESNALVLVLSAAAPATTDELAFLSRARRHVKDMLIVESAGPEATDADAVASADRAALRDRDPALGALPVIVVSPLDAHDAMTEPDPVVAAELRALSGLDLLAQRLLEDVLDPEIRRQSELLESEILSCLDELAGPDRALVASLSGLDPAAAIERARVELEQSERASPVAAFDGRFSELRREVDASMQAQISAERDELLDRIEDEWSGALAAALPDLCRAMLATAATESGGRLAGDAGPLAAAVAERHQLGAVMTTLEAPAGELKLELPGRPRASRQLDQERMLGWLTRGGPMLMIGVVTANPILVGIGVAVVAASEHIQGSSSDRRRAREYVQRAIARGQLELRTAMDERAASVRAAFAEELNTRHNARLERLRTTVRVLETGAGAEGARERVEKVDRLQAALNALASPGS
ncbi:MAG TPA: dynamin family protein [Solirubrobacteraceae bacterium]|nr:dynamin family protein [Solirubrobacteraceae bacterium]